MAETAEKIEERNYESEAREQGWKPEEEWSGDPPKSGFKTAEQFIKDGENITPILKSKVDRLESRVEELRQSNKEITEFTQASRDRDRKEKERLIAELQTLRTKAVTEGDGEAFQKADEQIEELRKEAQPEPDSLSPDARDFLSDNTWYGSNDRLTIYADGLGERLQQSGYSGKAYFDELVRQVKDTFPDEFGNKRRKQPNSVESGGEAVTDSKAKTFDSLPADAKAQYERFARDIEGFTKEAYVEQYDWEQSDE